MSETEHDYYRNYIEERYQRFTNWYNELFKDALLKPLDWKDPDFMELYHKFEQDYSNHELQQKIMNQEAV